ncbi:MAG: hypothetical protein A3D31_06795 [Candidatus Fluviicola riflensis]|nr:MAG: hypothetical protein CHH17_08215 [Candidatus Fluviicola riflensis]OGS79663.1 MAG: hypothetical protein A3D31_06795 [Candidatus Fluviicola riflensis]OGS87095.1 MAG: hypothetical protein A2724_06255 [Fluviicola sp. RIFCSPHIGHO2_01_FULL_43_53]OGS89885.1 MAG: hypothetical protein A3E30_03000 [Fluviicola sp. RIFCSPHIGHO2_12_FULL_43_24]
MKNYILLIAFFVGFSCSVNGQTFSDEDFKNVFVAAVKRDFIDNNDVFLQKRYSYGGRSKGSEVSVFYSFESEDESTTWNIKYNEDGTEFRKLYVSTSKKDYITAVLDYCEKNMIKKSNENCECDYLFENNGLTFMFVGNSIEVF